MEGAANTAALANQAAHDTNARIRLVEHLDAKRRGKLKAIAAELIKRYPKLHADPDEIVNEMLTALYMGCSGTVLQTKKDNDSFYSLLKLLIKRTIRGRVRHASAKKRSVHREQADPPEDFALCKVDHEAWVACQDVIEKCFEDIDELPNLSEPERTQLKDLLVLRLEATYGWNKIASIMGLSVPTVRRLFTSLKSVLKHRSEDLE